MSSILALNQQMQLVFHQRDKKRTKVHQFFAEHIGQRFTSAYLHAEFGSSVRTRISEINRNQDSDIVIVNDTQADDQGRERSIYYAVKRG